MEDPIRISLAPRTMVALWLGAMPPLVVGLATGGLAAAFGGAFAIACPMMLVVSGARWSVRARYFFPVYFAALFLVALGAFEFNSIPFVVDTWSALIFGVLTMPVGRPLEVDPKAFARAPDAGRRSSAKPWQRRTPSFR